MLAYATRRSKEKSAGETTVPTNLPSLPAHIAVTLFVIAVLAGYRYRRVWKAEGPRWQLWLSGLIAALCLLSLAFLPVRP